jgi:hypothetical protein
MPDRFAFFGPAKEKPGEPLRQPIGKFPLSKRPSPRTTRVRRTLLLLGAESSHKPLASQIDDTDDTQVDTNATYP